MVSQLAFQKSLLKSASSASTAYAKAAAKKQEEDDQKALVAQSQANAQAQKQKESKSSLLGGAVDWLKDAGKNIVAGTQQAAGNVADVAIEGGSLLGQIGDITNPFLNDEQKQKKQQSTIAATDTLRKNVHDKKDVTGQNIEGTQDVDAAATRIANGKASGRDVAQVAGKSLETGLDATMLINPTAGVIRNAEKQLVTETGKTVAKSALKENLKLTAKDAAVQGAGNAGATGLQTYGETGDLGKSVEEGAKAGLISAVTQGTLDTAGQLIGKSIGDARNKGVKEANAANAEATATKEAADAADLKELEARPFRDASDEDLQKTIDQFDNPEGDAPRSTDAYKMVQAAKDEQFARQKQTYVDNGGKSLEDAQKELDDFNSGNLPDNVYRNAEPVQNAAEVAMRDDLPGEVKSAAMEVLQDRKAVEDQLYNSGLMSKEAKDVQLQQLNDEYEANLRDLNNKYGDPTNPGSASSDMRFQQEKQRIDEQYKDDTAELDLLEEQDAPEVEKYSKILDTLDRRDQQISRDVNNAFEQAEPGTFRDIDGTEYQAHKTMLEKNIETAKQYADTSAEVTRVAESADPVSTYNRSEGAQSDMKTDASDQLSQVVDNFKNIKGAQLSLLRVMSPSQVLEKWGLRGNEIDLHSEIIKAEASLDKANKADSIVLTDIAKELNKSPEAQTQIIDYIEGKRQTLSGIEDQKSAESIKAWLDEKKAGLEAQGYKTLDDYFPHVFDKKDPQVQSLFANKTTGEIAFGNLKGRQTDSEDFSRDIMNVLTKYASGYNRKTILEPALKPLADLKTQVNLQEAESKWVDSYIDQLKGFNQSNVGDAYNNFIDGVFKKTGLDSQVGKNHFNATLGFQRMASSLATMGLNPATAIRNMTQMVNTVAEIGPRYSTVGAVDGMRMWATKEGRAELKRNGIIDGGVSQNYFDAISAPGVKGRVNQVTNAAAQGMMSMIRGTDIMLRAQAYAGAKALATAKGLTGKEAENFAIRKVVDTQFITSRVDMPVAFNGQAVRSLTQLATFSGKQAGFLQRAGMKMIKDPKTGNFHLDVKQAGSVLAAVGAAAGMTELLKPLLGFKETEWIPFYDQVAPFYTAATGKATTGGDSLYRSPLVQLLAGDGKSKTGLIQALTSEDGVGQGMEDFIKDNWSSLIPGGAQAKKTLEGYGTTNSGVSRNDSGAIRYLQNTDDSSKLQASLFGQYSTENGQNWIQRGFPTLSDKQTSTVDGLGSDAEKQKYVDYYQATKAASGRQDAYDAVKEAASNGKVNEATRLAQEWNSKLDDALKPYWQNNDSLPKDLQDDLLKKKYINVNNILDKYEDE